MDEARKAEIIAAANTLAGLLPIGSEFDEFSDSLGELIAVVSGDDEEEEEEEEEEENA